jgi:hypothetical protein
MRAEGGTLSVSGEWDRATGETQTREPRPGLLCIAMATPATMTSCDVTQTAQDSGATCARAAHSGARVNGVRLRA